MGRYFAVHVSGVERVPPTGPLLVAINHRSMLDPVIVGGYLPRPVHFMAKVELFRIPVLGWLLPRVHAFPVRRGEADREAIAHALQMLRKGHAVGVFPEGTRSMDGRLLAIQGGTALLALKTGAPILPVAIMGTEQALPKGAWIPRRVRVDVRVGEPLLLEPPEGVVPREQVLATSQKLAEELRRLLTFPAEPHSSSTG